jgi:hypothetical protein
VSQYTNKMHLNLAEVATLSFNHEMTIDGQTVTTTVGMVTMQIECLKEVHRVIGASLQQYEEQSEPISRVRKGMN